MKNRRVAPAPAPEAPLTERQRALLRLFNGLTPKQQEEYFKELQKRRNRRTTSS
jgi:hypothetical protein